MKPRIIKTKDYTGSDRRLRTADRRQEDRTVYGTFYITKDEPVGKMKRCMRIALVDRRLVERAKKQIRTIFYISGINDAASEYREIMQELASRAKRKEISTETARLERAKLAAFMKELIKEKGSV